MADIHVETKKHNTTPAWIWILVTVAIVVLAAYFLTRSNASATDKNTGVNNATSYAQPANIETSLVYSL